ncbi:MAG: bifunctional transcriptional activator/DNA repair enzyme AdaA [Candidatus Krumholzibacteriia bacterium]
MLNFLPPTNEMYGAIVARNRAYDGVFFTAVRTTGIFCRPTCPAKKPRPENVEFYASVREALAAGYRPCKRCRPMRPDGSVPEWLEGLLEKVDRDPSRRWKDADLRGLSIDPIRVRRWFRAHYGMTFHAYQRARRLGLAMGQIRHGADLTYTAYDNGFESLSGFRDAFAKLFGETPGRSRASVCVTVTRVLTPLGPMVAGATEDGVCLLEFTDRRMLETQIKRLRKLLNCVIAPGSNPHIAQVDDELGRYFEGTLREFTVPLVVPGTEFQRSVWENLQRVPYGETGTYDAIARAIGRPGAQRAVGKANGDNRLAIIIPCHRIVRSDGRLWGYGGGIWRKRFLIDHERKHLGG